jgi:hypothetical protein
MRYGSDNDIFVIGLGDLTVRTEMRISVAEQDRMLDALTLHVTARNAAALPVDEPELITGDAD